MLFPGSPDAAAFLQKITLAPNCTCRDGVAVESNSPAVPGDSWLKPSRPLKVKLLVGAWKFVWLKTLKASTLSWRLTDSEMRVSPDESGLAEGALAREAAGMAFGRSTAGAQGYMGPRPVPGHGPHRYIFQILPLSRCTAFSSAPKLKAFMGGISGTVIGRGMLMGTYERR